MLYKEIKSIIRIPRGTVYILIVYSILLGILSLTIPISVQTLVNTVGTTLSARPLISITTILFILLVTSFSIKLLQIYLVEHIKRKTFVNLCLKIAKHINIVKLSSFAKQNIVEKVNRTFEIGVIQKAIYVIFIILFDIALQAVFCILILAFYHPLFLVFDIVLIICILLSIFLPFKKAYNAAIKESSSKYSTISWIEEQANSPLFFRQGNDFIGLEKVDNHLCGYLENRKEHFKWLAKHYIYIGIIYILINTILLSLGGYLIIQSQLSLGQLIAAELLVNIVLIGLLRVSYYLEDFYNFLVAIIKLSEILDLPQVEILNNKQNSKVKLNKVTKFEIINKDKTVHIFDFNENNIVNYSFNNGIYSALFSQFFDENNDNKEENFLINDINSYLYESESLLKNIIFVRNIEIFKGNVLDNLLLLDSNIDNLNELNDMLKDFNLESLKTIFYKEIDSQKVKYDFNFNDITLAKITIIRAILQKPKLLILLDLFSIFDDEIQNKIIKFIQKYNIPTIIMK